MSAWKCGKWISSHPPGLQHRFFLFSSSSSLHSRCCRPRSRHRLMLHLHSSILRSHSPPPSFHYLLPPWTSCLGLFKVIGSCPSSPRGQLGSEVSDLFLIGWNGMVIVALCCHSVEHNEISVSKMCGDTFSLTIFIFMLRGTLYFSVSCVCASMTVQCFNLQCLNVYSIKWCHDTILKMDDCNSGNLY